MNGFKNKRLLEDFTKYCDEHPSERFWQALRNWSKHSFILTADYELDMDEQVMGNFWKNEKDTFYKEGK